MNSENFVAFFIPDKLRVRNRAVHFTKNQAGIPIASPDLVSVSTNHLSFAATSPLTQELQCCRGPKGGRCVQLKRTILFSSFVYIKP